MPAMPVRPSEARRPALVSRWRTDEAGATSLIFAVMLAVLLLVSAIAVDWGRGVTEKWREQDALDAATLAASHALGMPNAQIEGERIAEAYFRANVQGDTRVTLDNLTIDTQRGEVRGSAFNKLATTLLRVAKIYEINIGVTSTVKKTVGTIEVAMVLDNSGSMAQVEPDGTIPMESLKTAALQLVDIVMAGSEGSDRVRVALVPYSEAVNVGRWHRGANWIDNNGLSPIHGENFAGRDHVTQARSRFDLFDAMGQSWRGCVEVRPAPHDVADTVPTASNPATLFVPMFAPDEPDDANDGTGAYADGNSPYSNNYVADDGSVCPRQQQTCTGGYDRRGNCRSWSKVPIPAAVAQARTCKYDNVFNNNGPHFGCSVSPILPLSSRKQEIQDAIRAMSPRRWTNILEGVMWGWRVLSPEPPFTEGREWDDNENAKFMIVMSDGKNEITNVPSSANMNRSEYTAFGYAAKGRLGSTFNKTAYDTLMDNKTIAGCTAAKAKGIRIYGVKFGTYGGASSEALLRNCASGPDKYFLATNSAGLIEAFREIARDISRLRVAG